MDYKSLFYWLTVADNAKTFFGWFAIFFTLIFIISMIVKIADKMSENPMSEQDSIYNSRWIWYSTPLMILFLSLWVFTPNKRDALLIVAGGETMNFLTTDESAKEIPHELTSFVVTELKNMAKDAEVDLNIKNEKQKILDEVKNMSATEVIERVKTDSIFAKIILEDK